MTDLLCGFFDLIGDLLNSLLPSMPTNGAGSISSAIAFFVNLIGAANYLFPVSTLFEAIGILMVYKVFNMSVWIVNWVIRTVRG